MAAAVADDTDTPMSSINTTPLVDVMLVLLIIFLIAVPVAIQQINKLKIPIIETIESKDKVENLLLTVASADEAGRIPSNPDYTGSSRQGQCLVYYNNTTMVDSTTLREDAFKRLDDIVTRAGGVDVIMENPELIPEVHIRGDVNAPWSCVAGAIYNVQAAGYPTVGFISNPVEPGI